MLSESLRNHIQELLDQPVNNFQPVSGGSINRAAKITTADGKAFFLKCNGSAPPDMFPKEKEGLELLKTAESGLRVPTVIGTGTSEGGTDFIVTDYIPEGTARSGSSRVLGQQLAALHRVTADQYGLNHDNYIGRLPQSNTQHKEWIDFLVSERFEPQVQMAIDDGKMSAGITKHFQRLYQKLPDILAEEPPSLLHGDLWGGNYFFDNEGSPTIYDPAVYYGNREIEIAFTHLFGGFSSGFYDTYNEAFSLQPGFAKRKDIYNLYPLLVHTNLFGASYAQQVEKTVERFA